MSNDRPCSKANDVRRLLYSAEAQDEETFRALTAHLDECEACRSAAQVDDRETEIEEAVRSIDRQAETHPYHMRLPVDRLNKLLPHYEILEEIGRGGMGVVYRARQLNLDRIVALKVLPAIMGVMQPDAVARFRREAAITAGLKHSNIIAVYESGEADGTLYYAMELVEGRSLHEIIEDRTTRMSGRASANNDAVSGPDESSDSPGGSSAASGVEIVLTESTPQYIQHVTDWIADAAEALHYAHENGVIHRDVKPSNLLLTRHGRVMISDFGLARPSFAATMTLSPALMGTCRYMSPEQVDSSGRVVDHLTDIYSLGVTLYEMLALEPPFANTEYHRIIYDILHSEPKPLRRIQPEVPRDLETICLRSMEKDRRRRYPSARAMADDLRRVRLGLPIQTRRPSRMRTSWRWLRRHPKAVVAGACFALLAGALAFTVDRIDRLRQAAVAAKAGEIDQWLFEAQSELADGDAKAAFALVESALVAYPERMELWLMKGRTLLEMGRTEDARQYLSRQLQRDSSAWPVRQMLASLPEASVDANPKRVDETEGDAATPALRTSRHFYFRALCESKPDRAVALLDEAIALNPDNLQALWYRGLCRGELREFDKMLLDVTRVVEMQPRWAVTQGEFGRALRWVGRAEEADAALTIAIGIEPKRARWYAMRSEARFYLMQLDRSLSDAEAALQLNPDIGMAYTVRGSVKMALRRIEEGEADFRKAIEIMPGNPQTFIRRGLLRALLGSWREGLADLTRATELDPNILCPWDNSQICIHHHRGLCYLTGGRDPEAVAEFTIALELPPKRWTRSLLPRAACYFRMFQFEECIADTTRAIDLKLADPLAYVRRATAYELIGAADKALADYETVVRMDGPTGKYADAASCLLLREIGRGAEAEPILARNAESPDDGRFSSKLFAYLRGDWDAGAFLTGLVNPAEVAEAHYFVGRRALADGRVDDAMAAFERALEVEGSNTFLVEIARARLHVMSHQPADDLARATGS